MESRYYTLIYVLGMEKWRKDTKAKAANHQWVEEWTPDNWEWPCKDIKICYPVQKEQ